MSINARKTTDGAITSPVVAISEFDGPVHPVKRINDMNAINNGFFMARRG